jgi:hypothetical protein
VFLVLGAVCAIGGIALVPGAGVGVGVPVLLAGLVLAAFGAAYLGPLPIVVVTDTEVRSMTAGPAGRIRLDGGAYLDVRDDAPVVVDPEGTVRRVPVYEATTHPDDWRDLLTMIRRQRREQG